MRRLPQRSYGVSSRELVHRAYDGSVRERPWEVIIRPISRRGPTPNEGRNDATSNVGGAFTGGDRVHRATRPGVECPFQEGESGLRRPGSVPQWDRDDHGTW